MAQPNKLFGTDGVRGVANVEPVTAETALKLGRAAAHVFTQLNPRTLPEGTRVVHKTGTISGSTNDTGVVFLPGGGHLLMTVFTKDAKAPAADREHVAAFELRERDEPRERW